MNLLDRFTIPVDQQLAPAVGAAKLLPPGTSTALDLDWVDLLAAALTVGKPNFSALLSQHPYGFWEAQRRITTILANLEHDGLGNLVRSSVYRTSDGTEMAGISYAIGMTVALCVARDRFGIAHLMHFDEAHGIRHGKRPDLVDPMAIRDTFVEAKGSSSFPKQSQMASALDQLRTPPPKIGPPTTGIATCAGFRAPHGVTQKRLVAHVQYFGHRPMAKRVSDATISKIAPLLAQEALVSCYGPLALWVVRPDSSSAVAGERLRSHDQCVLAWEPTSHLWMGLEVGTLYKALGAIREMSDAYEWSWPDIDSLPRISGRVIHRGPLAFLLDHEWTSQ
jgi:hypothetical protein